MQQEPGGARCPCAAGPPGPTGQQLSCHKCQKVRLGCPRAGISWPQDFSGQRAATSFPCGRHPEVFLHFPHQGAVSVAGDGQFLWKFLPSIVCMLRPLKDELRGSKKGLDKVEGLVAIGCQFFSRKASTAFLKPPSLPYNRSGLIVVVDTSATPVDARQEGLAAPGIPLQVVETAQQKYFSFDRELFAC
jgi:hypothetical protein